MPSVDRNLLRLALYEMLEVDEVAIAVTIDESVELAKAFGSEESPKFINGVLGRVASKMDKGVDVVAEAKRLEAERAAHEDAEDDECEGAGVEARDEAAEAVGADDEGLGEE